jgi:hypothetical protein
MVKLQELTALGVCPLYCNPPEFHTRTTQKNKKRKCIHMLCFVYKYVLWHLGKERLKFACFRCQL